MSNLSQELVKRQLSILTGVKSMNMTHRLRKSSVVQQPKVKPMARGPRGKSAVPRIPRGY